MAELSIDRGRAAWMFVTIALRILLAGLFVFAAVMKLDDLDTFAREIRQYKAIPDAWSVAAANIVPWFELVLAGLLLTRVWQVESRVLFLLMLVGFTALKLSAEIRGMKIDCGCFGSGNVLSQALSGWWGVGLNAVLLAMLGVESLGGRRLRRSAAAAVGDAGGNSNRRGVAGTT